MNDGGRASIRLFVVASAVLFGLGAVADAQTPPGSVETTLPPGMSAAWLVRFAKPPDESSARSAHFLLDAEGRAFLLLGNTLVVLRPEMDPASDTIRINGVERVDQAAWMPDGALLAISGRKLGKVNSKGFSPILDLPCSGMKLRAASADECYLFGGQEADYRGDVYLYRKGGKLARLVRSQEPVTAVAGSGRFSFIALGRAICVLGDGEALRVVHRTEGDVTDLALVPPSGVVYATATTMGYVSRPGVGFAFMRAEGARPALHGNALYAFIPGRGLLRCSPAALLERMAADLVAQKSGGIRLSEGGRAALNRGVEAAQRKEWDAASASFTVALEDAPHSPDLMMNLAQAAEGAGGREIPAIVWYHAYLALAPAAPDAPIARARIAELTARVQANARRLRQEGMDGLRRIAAEAAGKDRDDLYRDLAEAQVRAKDLGSARGTAGLIADEYLRDTTLARVAEAMADANNLGGALEAISQIRTPSNADMPRNQVGVYYVRVGSLEAAEAAVRGMSSSATMRTAYARLAEEMLGRGRLADAARLARLANDAGVMQCVNAGIALKQADAGALEEARRTASLGTMHDTADSLTALRLASTWATIGDMDEARKAMATQTWEANGFWRVLTTKEVALRLHARQRDAEARTLLEDILAAAGNLKPDSARHWAMFVVVDVLCSMGSYEDAESTAWLIEDRRMRDSALGRVTEARGPLDRAEAGNWRFQAQGYDDYPLVYGAVRNLRAHLDSLKGQSPRSVFVGLTGAADSLENGLESIASNEKKWQEKRAAKK